MWNQWLIVIPARLKSTRLPEKPLADLKGKPLVMHVYDKVAHLTKQGAEVVVATDSERIVEACARFGAKAVMTGEHHVSGTSRAQEVAAQFKRPYVMNVQGDEPFINAQDIEALAAAMTKAPHPEMATLFYRNHDPKDFSAPSLVKVVADNQGFALYFSRSPIPHHRTDVATFQEFMQHLGVYAYTREAINKFVNWPVTEIEQKESLEQLRALANGLRIFLVEAKHPSIGIDTPEDLAHARAKI